MMDWTPDKTEAFLQELLAAGGYITGAIQKLGEDKPKVAMSKLDKALMIINKAIKSIRGF